MHSEHIFGLAGLSNGSEFQSWLSSREIRQEIYYLHCTVVQQSRKSKNSFLERSAVAISSFIWLYFIATHATVWVDKHPGYCNTFFFQQLSQETRVQIQFSEIQMCRFSNYQVVVLNPVNQTTLISKQNQQYLNMF